MTGKRLPAIIIRSERKLHYHRASCPRTHHGEANPLDPTQTLWVRNGFVAVACDGEAHSNPHIDNCMRCAPMWGVMAAPTYGQRHGDQS